MRRFAFFPFAVLALVQFMLSITLSSPPLAQEWAVRGKPRGILKVVDLYDPSASVVMNYAEGLLTVDKDNKYVPCLAKDWGWLDDRTIEFKLREDVRFHNGEKFDAEAVRINWEEYKKMESPRVASLTEIPDETEFVAIDDFTVRFVLPEPDGLALSKFFMFVQIAPAFFAKYKVAEKNWGYLEFAGPWGTGPFELVEGSLPYGRPSDRVVLEAYEGYWDRRYPKVQRVIFDNTLIADREEAMRLCREEEGFVDLIIFIRPLDTLKVAESPFAKVVKSKDFTLLYAAINQRKKGSKWRDARLRKAINYAINRKELWKYAAKGNAYNLGGFILPGAYGHSPELKPYRYDTTKARALLAEAGYPKGFDVKIITSEAWKLEAQIIGKMLERIDMKVDLDVLTMPEFLSKFYRPLLDRPPEEQEWDLAFFHLHDCYGHVGASFLLWPFFAEGELRWIESDPVYNEMWMEMSRTLNRQAQVEEIRQMVKHITDQAYCLMVYTPLTLYAVNKEVDFVPYKRTHLHLKEASVTDSHWSIKEENQ